MFNHSLYSQSQSANKMTITSETNVVELSGEAIKIEDV